MLTKFTLIQVTSPNLQLKKYSFVFLLQSEKWRIVLFRQCIEAVSFPFFLKTLSIKSR